MERLIYAPEVLAYIQTTDGQQFDLSNDIIDGSLTRNVNELSTLSLRLQNRYNSDGSPLYMGKILPMDKIVVYLKKTKPILVFSGYLDLVPFYQPIPAPITIEASCTLKRLEFTYWDPGVVAVMQKLHQLGFIYDPTTGAGWLPDRLVAGSKTTIAGKTLNDTGFAALLRFLLQDVGQWKDTDVYISPLPEGWIARIAGIYKQVLEDTKQMESYIVDFVNAMFNSSASADSSGSSSTSDTFNGDMVAHLTSYLKNVKSPYPAEWASAADSAGKTYNIDPRFLIAITGQEETFGLAFQAKVLAKHNAMGLGGPIESNKTFPSWQAMFNYAAKNLADNYIGKGLKTINDIQTKWAPLGAANDPANLNSSWRKNVKKFYGDLGGNPETSNLGYPQSSTTSGSTTSLTSATELIANTTMPAGASGLTVQIQAGHSSPRSPGFLNQTGGTGEMDQNIRDKASLESALKKYSNISVSPASGSTPDKTFDGDVYIAIHHDDVLHGIGWPGSWSVNNLGNPFPNICGSNDSGNTSPPPIVRTVNDNSALSSNSKQLAYAIADALKNAGYPMQTDSCNSMKDAGGHLRMGNYYGFYYNNSKATIILEMPASSSPAVYNAIALGIDNYRKQKRQAVYNSSNTGGVLGGVTQGGTNSGISNAQALINTLVNFVKNNPNTPYASPGERGKALDKITASKGVDCSGFVGDGMISIGVEQDGYSPTTVTLPGESTMVAGIGKADPSKLEPGTFIINPLPGASGHIVVYIGNNKIVQSSGGKGPNVADYTAAWPGYGAYVHKKIGTTTNPVYGATNTGGSNASTTNDAFSQSLKSAFNVTFNFPVDIVQSTFLTGYRSFENDVKLLESVEEVTKASMRVFSSLPDGGFIAWYPDYFNISGRTPWFIVSTNEIIDCTIDLSDKYLATHVYLTGNPWSYPGDPTNPQQNFLELMRGAGVATIEQPYILDSFLRQPVTNTPKDRRPQSIIESQGAVANFLSKYGVRPYNEKQLTLRHPAIEFFYAYHRFMEMWAKQFISKIELTFQPEIFPGMIVELEEKDGPGFAVYVDQVSHSFSYSSGFTTQINVMAISSLAKSGPDNTSEIHPSMALISRSATPLKFIPVKTTTKNKTKSTATKTISSRGAATKGTTSFGIPNLSQAGLLG